MLTFEELGLSEASLSALGEKGFIYPTPIQEQVIPALLTGSRDIIGQAQTGTGKTAAFGLPILDCVDTKDRAVQALVLVPTRELAVQVAAEIDSLRGPRRILVDAVYGGQSIERQFRSLQRGVHIVVGTPGRVLDHLRRRSLDLSSLSFLVLDEADEMLDQGFLEDIEEVIEASHPDRRMLLFSATMPERIVKIARSHMKEFSVVNVKGKDLTIPLTSQKYIEVKAQDKVEVLRRCIDMEEDMHALVF
ncbi:MAG TPA: DEAD/DEAH box helicase, partial [Spirochaetales bacterium]|nr:DEAD/DEAH box helicase [Spirochaetales bacterium]